MVTAVPAYAADVALQTSPEQPAPLFKISGLLREYIERLGAVWVEGQITQLSSKGPTTYLTLRDVTHDFSMNVTTSTDLINSSPVHITTGSRVVIHANVQFWDKRGTLSLRADEFRAVGLGELLARIARLTEQLRNEGLFADERKKPLPFLPRRVGLICGRNSDAEHDVVRNARHRWPNIEFETLNVSVQGNAAVEEVTQALTTLDEHPEVEVIVIARGGGSTEDLLVFSDEELVRAVVACHTPVVSAIGHEEDRPLLDYVADVRASTPTDAARRIVPDLNEQVTLITTAQQRLTQAITRQLDRETQLIHQLASRPALADPRQRVEHERTVVADWQQRSSRALLHGLTHASTETNHLTAQLRTVSPVATLERGYAVVSTSSGEVVRTVTQAQQAGELTIRLANGSFAATTDPAHTDPAHEGAS